MEQPNNNAGSSEGFHVVDIELEDAGGATSCCVVCTEPLEWATIGRCGHRVVCSKCMVRIRFFDGQKRCCICRTHCPKVVVTKGDSTRGAAALSALPSAAGEGRAGKFWYNKMTAAYFDDERQYEEVRAACKGEISPFYQPLDRFILLFASSIVLGAFIGYSGASETRHISFKVIACALSIFFTMSIAGCFWFMPEYCSLDSPNAEDVDLGSLW